jgi:hypothetical protein
MIYYKIRPMPARASVKRVHLLYRRPQVYISNQLTRQHAPAQKQQARVFHSSLTMTARVVTVAQLTHRQPRHAHVYLLAVVNPDFVSPLH